MEQMQNTDTCATNENSSQTNHQNVRCGTFRTSRELLQYVNFCQSRKSNVQQTVIEPEVPNNHSYDKGHNDVDQERFYWNEVAGSRFEALVHDAFEKVTQWKRNIFILPTVASGKKYIDKTTCIFNS